MPLFTFNEDGMQISSLRDSLAKIEQEWERWPYRLSIPHQILLEPYSENFDYPGDIADFVCWLRYHVSGEYARVSGMMCFRDPDDAFAYRMRWSESDPF